MIDDFVEFVSVRFNELNKVHHDFMNSWKRAVFLGDAAKKLRRDVWIFFKGVALTTTRSILCISALRMPSYVHRLFYILFDTSSTCPIHGKDDLFVGPLEKKRTAIPRNVEN